MAVTYRLTSGELNGPADPDAVERLSEHFGVKLPDSYLDFLRKHDGGEGFIGPSYLVLWRAEDLPSFNREYEVEMYAPGIILFGSDGAGDGYGFDTQSTRKPMVSVPFIGMDRRYLTPVAYDFAEFFEVLRAAQ